MPQAKPAAQPGFLSQGTQVQAAGAWFRGNLIRWRPGGQVEKMAGWARLFQAPFMALIRRMHAWLDLDSNKNLLVGTDLGLQIGIQDTQYTLARQTNVPFPPPLGNPQKESWFLENLGQNGLVLVTGGPLEVYQPPISSGAFTTAVGVGPPATAPQHNNGMLVAMPQAQVILWGSEPIMGSGVIDPLLIRWSDVGTYDVYTATVSNQAGSFRLSRGSKIMGAIQAPQTTLIFTDLDVWAMNYVGPPLIYGFTVMGSGCGLLSAKAVASLGRLTAWMAKKNFWQYGDGGVQIVPCSVWDYIFEDLDTVNINKAFAAPNSSSGEIAFFFPSLSALLKLTDNLLLWSQQFDNLTRWSRLNAIPQMAVNFVSGYVYEPLYVNIGWPDDTGLALISWLDRDVQSKPDSPLTAPDGTFTTTKLIEQPVNDVHQIWQTIDKLGKRQLFNLSLYVHNSSTRNLTLRAIAMNGSALVTFDVINGLMVATGATGAFTLVSWGAVTDELATGPAGNGWRRYFMTFITDDTELLSVYFNLTMGASLSYLGTGNFAYIWGAQLSLGSDLLGYQMTGATQPQNETTHYVKYNTVTPAWDSGILSRSAWLDNSIWGTALGGDSNLLVQQHERGYDADDEPMRNVFAETGFTELGDGSTIMATDQCQPDLKWFGLNGEVTVTLRTTDYAGGPQQSYGPFSMTPTTQFFDPRARARYVAVRYDWAPLKGFSARIGVPTYRIKPAGRRP